MADLLLGSTVGEVGEPLAVESDDLTTHGVIVGMTGSGKTGLGVVVLEETLLAGVPALILDPKGDMGNLLLTFPDLAPADFRPWVSEDDARAARLSVDELATKTAADWEAGLKVHGIGPDRIRALRDAAEATIYTPGSEAGVPLNVVGSLQAPPLSWETEAETLRDEIEGTVMSLLALVGIEADPLASREFVLLSNLLENAWRAGRDLDLATLIGEVQSPPLRKLGVFDIDSFFPPKERTALALRLNGLLASPAFAAWGKGVPLDIGALLRTPAGKPRAAIVYLAHLSEEERQFAVTLVLSKLVTWMRAQPGTSDLRALVYMDEVFGFAPPTAAPPAKKPILTIFKQARAFGVGMVLATQNPVDLDYKAMSNAGTWMVGRLQTDNDKARVLDGLKSAAGGADLAALDAAIGGLGKREFMLVSAKSSEPLVFATRWAMSYLRGPLTRDQVALLIRDLAVPVPAPEPADAPPPATGATPVAPPVAAGIQVAYLDVAAPWAARLNAAAGGGRLRAYLAARVSIRFDDAKAAVDAREEYEALYGPLDEGLDLERETVVDFDDRDFGRRGSGRGGLRAPDRADRRGVVLPRRRAGHCPAADGQPDAGAPPQRQAEADLPPRGDARGVHATLRPGGTGRSRRRDGEDPRPTRGPAGQARVGPGAGSEQGRGALAGRAHAPDERAGGGSGSDPRGAAGRPAAHALDRGRARRRRVATRDRRPRRRSAPDRRGQGGPGARRPAGDRAGDPRRGAGDRRQVARGGSRGGHGDDPP